MNPSQDHFKTKHYLRAEHRIEEVPAAYKSKPIAPVIDAQIRAGLVQVVARTHPILTFKA
ncbi:MAG: RtcB family protein [Mastigocoleus sp. MO_167.B18]|nr:RtcB family protein [Mastigocoleus sp. MO_167.B18]